MKKAIQNEGPFGDRSNIYRPAPTAFPLLDWEPKVVSWQDMYLGKRVYDLNDELCGTCFDFDSTSHNTKPDRLFVHTRTFLGFDKCQDISVDSVKKITPNSLHLNVRRSSLKKSKAGRKGLSLRNAFWDSERAEREFELPFIL